MAVYGCMVNYGSVWVYGELWQCIEVWCKRCDSYLMPHGTVLNWQMGFSLQEMKDNFLRHNNEKHILWDILVFNDR